MWRNDVAEATRRFAALSLAAGRYILVYTPLQSSEKSKGISALSALLRVTKAFEDKRVSYALVGGYAVALHGAVRGTVDIDCVIEHTEACFEACEAALRSIGLVPRLPVSAREVFQFREEYITRRNLIAWSFYSPINPIEVVDIIITHDLADLSAVSMRAGLAKVRVLSITDLMSMKRASARPQDLEDVRMLESILGK